MNQRIPKWLMLVCATALLAACSADSSVLGPAMDAAGTAARARNANTVQPSVLDDRGPRSNVSKQPTSQRGHRRYAMAAS